MCLEDTYPEHQFHVVEPFDKQKDEGVFADENGLEFKVKKIITYQSAYHFECWDEYLYEILNQQNYLEKLENILQKYNLELEKDYGLIYVLVQADDTLDTMEIAGMIKEILNCVEIPAVVEHEIQYFSTGEVNYYSVPEWGMVYCDFYDVTLHVKSGVRFYFEDKSEPVEVLAERMDAKLMEIQEEFGPKDDTENTEAEIQGDAVKTDFGSYVLQDGWSKNEAHSTDNLYMYTKEDAKSEDRSYFMIGCRTNPYTEERHKQFKQEILKQLLENDNLPEGAAINASGRKTETGNMVYSFEIQLSDDEVMKMHYIIGNKRHCLIQEVNYKGSEDCSNAVEEVIDSFIWQE